MARLALVVPSTTYRAGDFLEAAERLGVEVVVVSDQRQALAGLMGDRALRVDLRRPEAAARRIADHAERCPFDAVVGVDDQGVQVAALASEHLALPHSPAAAVAATRDKSQARRLLDTAGVQQPSWRVVATAEQAGRAAAELGAPVVVKPVSLSASRGVIRADSPQEAESAAARVRAILDEARAGGPLLVERYVPGDEVAVEALVDGGVLRILAIFDKPDPLEGPFFEETLFTTPSRHGEATRTAVADAAQGAVSALGLTEGPVHAEFRVDGTSVTTLEVAARTIGGLCGRALRFGVGMSLEEVVLRHALGLPLHALAREGAAAGVLMLPIERAGVLRQVTGLEAAREVDGIAGIEITVPAGHEVRPLPEADRYLGFAFARGRTPEEVEAALRAARALLEVHIDPPGTGPGRRDTPVGDTAATVGDRCASD